MAVGKVVYYWEMLLGSLPPPNSLALDLACRMSMSIELLLLALQNRETQKYPDGTALPIV